MLIYKALLYGDNLLLIIGALLIIWDGIKVGLQLYNFVNRKN